MHSRSNQRKSVKKTADLDESRRKREETANEIRKSKREENFLKKRNLNSPSASGERRVHDPQIAQKV